MALKQDIPKVDAPFATDGGVVVGTEDEMKALFEKLRAEQDAALGAARAQRESLDADDR